MKIIRFWYDILNPVRRYNPGLELPYACTLRFPPHLVAPDWLHFPCQYPTILVEANLASTVLMAFPRVTMSAATLSNCVFNPPDVTGFPEFYTGAESICMLNPDPDLASGAETVMVSCLVFCSETMALVFWVIPCCRLLQA